MIAYLKGVIEKVGFEQVIVLVGGIGYGVRVPVSDAAVTKPGDEVSLYISEVIREQSYDLYGFRDEAQQRIFERLIKVNGVGPRIALVLLGLGSYNDLIGAIQAGDTAYLTNAPGVGKKLAERLIIEVRGGLDDLLEDQQLGADENVSEAEAALLALGFKQEDARKMLNDVPRELSIEEQIKQALRK